jgi:hypothetical protein
MFNMSASMKMMDTDAMIYIIEKINLLNSLARSDLDPVSILKAKKEIDDYKNMLASKMLDDKRKFEMEEFY